MKNRTKEGQRKVRGPEWGPKVEQTALLAIYSIYLGHAWDRVRVGGEEKAYKKRSQRAGGLSLPLLSCTRALVRALSLSLSLSLSLFLLFVSLGQHGLMAGGCIFLLFSK